MWAVLGDALDRLDSFRLLLGKDHELDRLEPDQEGRNVERLVEAAIRQDSEPAGLITRSQAAQLAALVAFLERQKLVAADGEVVRLWRGDEFFHAKAYIARGQQVGALRDRVGELHLQRTVTQPGADGLAAESRRRQVLQAWFERHWEHEDAAPYTDELIRALRATPLVSDAYSPYEVLIRTLAGRYGSEKRPNSQVRR